MPGSAPTLVAITIRSRLSRAFSQRPMIRSDSPPAPAETPYLSAVSMKLPPASA
jgi:hypothetical protein